MNEMPFVHWRKSTRSGAEGGQCVEVADLTFFAQWRKSTRSGAEGGDCIEIADLSATVAVRDSKNPGGPVLAFTRPAFRAFAQSIRAGRYNR